MTTNQTIDGVLVSRELLGRILGHDYANACQECAIGQSAAWKELRALLDVPEPAPCAKSQVEPATQPQCEPRDEIIGVNRKLLNAIGARLNHAGPRDLHVQVWALLTQPAAKPVAVALPAQRNSADGRHDERVEGYNEALADVRRAISFSAKYL